MEINVIPTSVSNKSSHNTENDSTPPTAQLIKPLSFTNRALKNHHHHHLPLPPTLLVSYKECMKNHAATLGGHAVDGCGEFLPSSSATLANPTSLTCAACGCHRNFHRKEEIVSLTATITPPFLDFRQPPGFSLSPSRPTPRLFTLTMAAEEHHPSSEMQTAENPASRKRFRSRFSREQKDKMHSFSEKLGWKIQKCDEAAVKEFCSEIGVAKGAFKVWMYNNKKTSGKKVISSSRSSFMNGVHFHGSNDGSSSSI